MAKHSDLGNEGEIIAGNYLKNKGYEILHYNWRDQKAEVDIIAKLEELIVFVEVKTRSTDFFGLPEETISKKKIRLLGQASEAYCSRYNITDAEFRYDVVSVIKNENKTEIQHIEDAFFPNNVNL